LHGGYLAVVIDRAGSVCLNCLRAVAKWISTDLPLVRHPAAARRGGPLVIISETAPEQALTDDLEAARRASALPLRRAVIRESPPLLSPSYAAAASLERMNFRSIWDRSPFETS
jgi:hypothetical protein